MHLVWPNSLISSAKIDDSLQNSRSNKLRIHLSDNIVSVLPVQLTRNRWEWWIHAIDSSILAGCSWVGLTVWWWVWKSLVLRQTCLKIVWNHHNIHFFARSTHMKSLRMENTCNRLLYFGGVFLVRSNSFMMSVKIVGFETNAFRSLTKSWEALQQLISKRQLLQSSSPGREIVPKLGGAETFFRNYINCWPKSTITSQ